MFDATWAGAHARHNEIVTGAGKVMVDLTPAAIGPYVIPVVNGAAHYLPAYAGNLDIMTSAGLAVAEKIAAKRLQKEAA
ncbi:hypothetical protein DM806_10990 [Sphingobium lactosutens]|uniref:hypothetical protein n=1 Tax=Sphingobium lactosutens TaxID=522773 RepID=UPI0015BADE2B|nr:hypothetical protein [Sphingobium lactosutens]NWK96192.1 hypothetical protein [Sphingobium lactosutens]